MSSQPRNPILRNLRFTLLLVLLLSGCRPTRPAETPTPTGALPEPVVSASPLAPGPRPSDTQAPGPAETEAPQGTAIALASPSPTGCPRPEGWVIYTIQPGDTLQSLAERTGITVEELMEANCLSSTLIVAYEQLYLPRRPAAPGAGLPPPAAPPPAVVVQPPPVVDCNETLTCVLPGAPLAVLPGDPGNPGSYTPCPPSNRDGPWVDIHFGADPPPALQQGDRTFLYACGFNTGGGLEAEAVSEWGQKYTLDVYPHHPVPPLDEDITNEVKGVIDFPAIPDWPTGYYTVTVTIGSQSAQVGGIRINPPNSLQSFILPVPVAGSPGGKFDIYYVNYDKDAQINVVLYSADPSEYKDTYDPGLIPRLSWSVLIDHALTVTGTPRPAPAGWAMLPFTFPAEAVNTAYAVADQNRLGSSMIWIK